MRSTASHHCPQMLPERRAAAVQRGGAEHPLQCPALPMRSTASRHLPRSLV
uniref:Uncharacterized protein n=1 Tax=Setaria italica TaxID=4555 RepID=K3Z1N9_SETIT